MTAPVVITSGAAALDLERVRQHLRIDGDEQDELLADLIATAQQHVESVLDRTLTTATLEQRFDPTRWHYARVQLGGAPVRSIVSVSTVAGGVETAVAPGLYAISRDDGVQFGFAPPFAAGELVVRYVAGYGAPPAVPAPIKMAMLLIIGDLYANREAQIVGTITSPNRAVEALLSTFRVWRS